MQKKIKRLLSLLLLLPLLPLCACGEPAQQATDSSASRTAMRQKLRQEIPVIQQEPIEEATTFGATTNEITEDSTSQLPSDIPVTAPTTIPDDPSAGVPAETSIQSPTESSPESPAEPSGDIPTISVESPEERDSTANAEAAAQRLIAIDPGHQGWDVDMSDVEPDGPGSSVMKQKATSGTSGRYSGIPEYQLNLDISLLLRDELEQRGYSVLLTREDNQTAISNAERAQLANEASADVYLRIHANGADNSSAKGALALIPSAQNPYVSWLYEPSRQLADCVLDSYCAATGFANQGIQENDTMTGINWSMVPVIILEMGFMTNEQDDMAMADPAVRSLMVQGIANGLDAYFAQTTSGSSSMLETTPTSFVTSSVSTAPTTPTASTAPTASTTPTAPTTPMAPTTSTASVASTASTPSASTPSELKEHLEATIDQAEQAGESWSLYLRKVDDPDTSLSINNHSQQAASLIKLFIAATVEQERTRLVAQEHFRGEIDYLLSQMLSLSDNDAANTLVTYLGSGNAAAGIQKVNAFCQANGYTDTSMGRLLLDFDASTDNYTSVQDCCQLLCALEQGEIEGAPSILTALKQQTRTEKLPAGVPSGVKTANKTGELDHVENDATIVWASSGTYVLCVMTEALHDPIATREKLTGISREVYNTMVNT